MWCSIVGLEAELREAGCEAKAYPCDVSDPAAVEAVVAQASFVMQCTQIFDINLIPMRKQVRADYGNPAVYVHNAVRAGGAGSNILQWEEDDLIRNFQVWLHLLVLHLSGIL